MLSFFNDFVGLSGWESLTNLYEEADGYVAEIRATGIKKGDINIKFNSVGDTLLISSVERKREDGNRKWISHEFWPCRINTSLSLTKDIDREGITAKLEDGILVIRLPKRKDSVLPDSKRIIAIE